MRYRGFAAMRHRGFTACAAAAVALAGVLTACSSAGSGSSDPSRAAAPIVIGASVPLTGGLAGFGYFEKWGYQHAVDQVNADGGIAIDGVKHKVKLIVLDDQTNPNTTVTNVEQLIAQDHVTALLGSCTNTLVVPGALIAERSGVPMVTPCATTDGFASVRAWKWVWDIFFNSADLTQAPFKMIGEYHLATNKKLVILHSNGVAENIIGGTLWPNWAKQYGYHVTANVSYSPTSTQFTSDLQAAKAAGAQILLAIGEPPSLIAMRKQMVSVGFAPKMVVMEEGGEPLAFANALGSLANGVLVGGYWDSTFPYPGAAQLRTEFEQQTHTTYSQHIADTEAAAAVLLNAISRAGSLDAAKINAAIAQTNLMTVVGRVRFTAQHTYTLPMVEMQWQNGHCYVVAPANRANAKLIFPMPAS
jgi:branched-chain amino acid transport system substrate-binding protein